MCPETISLPYSTDGKITVDLEYDSKQYRILWTGRSDCPPDLSRFPIVDSSVTVVPVAHSPEVESVWKQSQLTIYASDAMIRKLNDPTLNSCTICKVAVNDRQRRFIAHEFKILSDLASKDATLRIPKIDPKPLADKDGVFGYRMEELSMVYPEYGHRYVPQITATVEQLHAHGVVHNDLSQSNIMTDREGGVVLIDFGRAGYVGDPIPEEKRLPKRFQMDDVFTVEADLRRLEQLNCKFCLI